MGEKNVYEDGRSYQSFLDDYANESNEYEDEYEEYEDKPDKHQAYDLAQMQALPLRSKVRMTMKRVDLAVEKYGEDGLYISDSGGKDSCVLVHLISEKYPDIEKVFADIPTQYPELRHIAKKHEATFLKPKMNLMEVCEKYGFPIFSKDISRNYSECKGKLQKMVDATGREELLTSKFWLDKTIKERELEIQKLEEETGVNFSANPRKFLGILRWHDTEEYSERYNDDRFIFLFDAPFDISNMCCIKTKEEILVEYQKKTGKVPITGLRADESMLRRSNWIRYGCNAFDRKRPQSNPISFWREQDELKYIADNNVELCEVYGDVVVDHVKAKEVEGQLTLFDMGKPLKTTGCKRTGCVICGYGVHIEKESRYLRLKETHPEMYNLLFRLKNNGVTMAEAIDWINEHSDFDIKY